MTEEDIVAWCIIAFCAVWIGSGVRRHLTVPPAYQGLGDSIAHGLAVAVASTGLALAAFILFIAIAQVIS